MNPFDRPAPRWFTIAAHRPFVDDLARGLHEALAPHGPEGLADATVLTPTRRGGRALAEAFVKAAGGRAVLLPQVRAVGDLEEGEPPFEPGDLALDLPAAATPLRRRFELARLVSAHGPQLGRSLDAPAALEMADALAGFLDSLWIEERFEPEAIEELGGAEHARHWLLSAEVLRLAVREWPRRLEAMGLIDPTDRRVRLTRLLARQWRERPPEHPLVVAGATGGAPATTELLAAAAAAPRGLVILPGLDKDLAGSAWDQIDEQHPQAAMKRLLEAHGLTRDQVHDWPSDEPPSSAACGRSRRRVVNEALRPAEATADWLTQIRNLREEGEKAGIDVIAEGLSGLSVIGARGEEEAAAVVALLMRETLESPDRTCALITPDQTLARRVSARLSRWDITADSSAGAPLSGFPTGVLAGLVAALACDGADPVLILAALKHPYVRLGLEPQAKAEGLDALERTVLRGPRRADWGALFEQIERKRRPGRDGEPPRPGLLDDLDRAEAFARRVHGLISPLIEGFRSPLPVAEAARLTAETLEALARDPAGGLGDLWSGPDGEAAARLFAALIEEGEALPAVSAEEFEALAGRLIAGETVRPGGVTHPRLRILGAIEGRMVSADRLILAGLEEGSWPAQAGTDPFLSRPMRRALGLPPPERAIGQSAHDFAQGACAPEVYLIHSERRDGQPAVRSRWLWRLQTVAAGAGTALPTRQDILDWARNLDAAVDDPPAHLRPATRPAPTPPLSARPKLLFVTQVEAWVRDPYAVYARNVLRLRAMDRPDEPVDARLRGTAIHAAMEAFSEAWPELAPDMRAATFSSAYLASLSEHGAPDAALTRERPLAARAADWIVDFETRRRAGPIEVLVEREARLKLPDLDFTLAARADRIEIAGGFAHVLDFKTGAAPSAKQVRLGFASQLPLTAAMIARGGLEGVEPTPPGELLYVRVTGRDPAGKEEARGLPGEALKDLPPSEETAEQAWSGLQDLVRRYQNPAQPYRSRTAPQHMAYASDYDHLARVREWSSGDDDGEAGQ